MAVSAVLRLSHLLAPYQSEPWYPPPYTGGTPVPLSKSPKGIGFWYKLCGFISFAASLQSSSDPSSFSSLVSRQCSLGRVSSKSG